MSNYEELQAYKRCFHMVVRTLRRLCSEERLLRCSACDGATVGGSVHRHAVRMPALACLPESVNKPARLPGDNDEIRPPVS